MAVFRGSPGARMSVKFSGDLEKRFKVLKRRAQSAEPAFRRFGVDMLRSTDRNFVMQGRRDAAVGVWAPLSPTTIARRRKGSGAGSPLILQDTGRLRGSITFQASSRHLEVGTNVEYAGMHQQGGRWGTSKRVHRNAFVKAHTRKTKHGAVKVKAHRRVENFRIPARPFLWFHEKDLKRFLDRLDEYITQTGGGKGTFKGV